MFPGIMVGGCASALAARGTEKADPVSESGSAPPCMRIDGGK